jgi:MoCo/4Fe-4S cofactor protein with predicted Tat translocation signal
MKKNLNHPAPETNPRIWRSLRERENDPEFLKHLQTEFPRGAGVYEDSGISKREFMKLMGASIALAGVGLAGCRRPESYLVPFTKGVEYAIPGKFLYYATSMPARYGAVPLIATTTDGRPTKLEGNPLHPFSNGGTDSFAQAEILNLYDPHRSKQITENGQVSDAAALDAVIQALVKPHTHIHQILTPLTPLLTLILPLLPLNPIPQQLHKLLKLLLIQPSRGALPLAFTPASGGNLISENRGSATGLVVALAGRTQQLFRNSWTGSVRIAPGSADMVLVGNLGLTVDGDAQGARVFNPPTFKQPHTSPVIVPGLGRFDFTVPGGKAASKQEKPVPVDLATVQTALDAARAEHPGTVLVLKLTGEYVSRSPEGLRLPPDTCVILEGRILADLGLPLEPIWVRGEASSQLITLPATGYSSVSGGRLDGARQASYPLNAKTGSLALIEGVQLASGARDGLYTKTRNAADPLFVYQCQAYANGSRGIWAHVATRVHSIGNTCISNNMDGIDLDAAAVDCTALFNTSNANRRHGVFIEEGITHNIVFGNQLGGNGGAGVHVWNEEVKKNTGPNVIAANACTANRRGVSNGGRAADISAHGNLFFNNICRDNWLNGVLAGNSHAWGSYFAQSDIGGNHGADIVGAEQAAFLATPVLQ